MLDEVEVLTLRKIHSILLIEFAVMVVSRVHQALNTLIQLSLKFSCGLLLLYMVYLYLWLTGRKRILNPLNV